MLIYLENSAIVVGAGGAGLRAAVGLAESGLETAVISKLVSSIASACIERGRERDSLCEIFGELVFLISSQQQINGCNSHSSLPPESDTTKLTLRP